MATTRTAGRHPTRPRPAPLRPPEGAARGPRLPDWFILIALAFMIASEYKFRRRSLADSLGGSLDIMVLAEIAVYGVAVLIMAAQHVKWGRPARPSIPMVVLWVYGGVMAASALYAPFPNLAMVRAGQLLIMIAYAQVLADRAEPHQFRHLARWYVGLMIVSIMVGLAYVAPTSRYQAGRFTWVHTHTVTAASMLAIGLVLAVGLLTIPPPGPRPRQATALLVGCIVVITAALFMTKTRGSIGGALVGLLVYTVLRVSSRRRPGVVTLLTIGVGGLLYFTLPVIEEFITRGEPTEGVTTLSNRTELWSVAWVEFQRKPLFGWGLTASRGLFFDAVQLGGAHNAFVNAAVDGGLIGLTAWLAVLVVAMVWMRRTWVRLPATRPQLAVCAAILATMVVNGITMEGLGSGAGASFLTLCILIAWVQTLQRTGDDPFMAPFGQESTGAPSGNAPRRRMPTSR